MDATTQLAAQQLARMRGMTALYHRQFFSDVRYTLTAGLALVVAAMVWDRRIFALVPIVALIGAAQTAFDASYLIFARHYARSLEQYLNGRLDDEVLVAARLEDTYLFPLDRPKLVTLPLSGGLTWFGFMTALYTLVGVGFFAVGMAQAWTQLTEPWNVWYVVAVGALAVVALVVGFRWFWGGAGERRLRSVLDDFPT